MDNATRNLSQYIKNAGFNITAMASATGIPYGRLYPSIVRDRDLHADEFLAICNFLGKDPLEFAFQLD